VLKEISQESVLTHQKKYRCIVEEITCAIQAEKNGQAEGVINRQAHDDDKHFLNLQKKLFRPAFFM